MAGVPPPRHRIRARSLPFLALAGQEPSRGSVRAGPEGACMARRFDWGFTLRANAADYARVAIANIGREFPYDVHQMMSEPGDFPNRPRDRNPVFYGSFDWHSCVEMHWLLVRLLRTAEESVPAAAVRA